MDNAPVKDAIITIDRLAFGGEGIGRIDGKVVFVPLTAQGDRVRVRITEDQNRYGRGESLEIVEPSPHRVTPRCSVFGNCGGCQWQHLDYSAQLSAKGSILQETLERIGKFRAPPLLPMIPAENPWNYRQRIQLHRNREGQIGYFAQGSRQIVEFENCEIADAGLNAAVRKIREDRPPLPESFEILLEKGEALVRDLENPDRVFSQVNPVMNGKLIEVVLQMVFGREEPVFSRKRVVAELYAGSGNLTFPMAVRAGRIIAVEEVKGSLGRAEETARRSSVSNVEFILGSAEWGLKKVHRSGVVVDTVVLDPPRRGAREILDLICVMKPRQVVYVSCDPPTLSRDLQFLAMRHYQLEVVQPLDMFPQTYHIESVAKLVRKNGG